MAKRTSEISSKARGFGDVAIQRVQSALAGALDCHGATRLAMTRFEGKRMGFSAT
ncbi:MAG: hypothetical protein LBB51_03485 [Zoogloeaceae bacterium]|jgi:hypothetical protein|nr:hypothetical protein [Zoogloeaceae bacterium]